VTKCISIKGKQSYLLFFGKPSYLLSLLLFKIILIRVTMLKIKAFYIYLKGTAEDGTMS